MSVLRDLLMNSSDSEDEENDRRPKTFRVRVNFDNNMGDYVFRERFRMRPEEVEFVLSQIGRTIEIRDQNVKKPYFIVYK